MDGNRTLNRFISFISSLCLENPIEQRHQEQPNHLVEVEKGLNSELRASLHCPTMRFHWTPDTKIFYRAITHNSESNDAV